MKHLTTAYKQEERSEILDILNNHGIETLVKEDFTEADELCYLILVDEENIEQGQQLLADFLPEPVEPEPPDYDEWEEEELVEELVYNESDNEARKNIREALNKKGVSDEEITEKITEEIKEGYTPVREEASDIFFGYLSAIGAGAGAIKTGYSYISKKAIHPVTKKQFYYFDEYTRTHGKIMLVLGLVVLALFLAYLAPIFF